MTQTQSGRQILLLAVLSSIPSICFLTYYYNIFWAELLEIVNLHCESLSQSLSRISEGVRFTCYSATTSAFQSETVVGQKWQPGRQTGGWTPKKRLLARNNGQKEAARQISPEHGVLFNHQDRQKRQPGRSAPRIKLRVSPLIESAIPWILSYNYSIPCFLAFDSF